MAAQAPIDQLLKLAGESVNVIPKLLPNPLPAHVPTPEPLLMHRAATGRIAPARALHRHQRAPSRLRLRPRPGIALNDRGLGPAKDSTNLQQPCCIPGGWTMDWSADAEAKLKEVPFFVRPAVRRRIESLAADAGRDRVDLLFFKEAKAQFGQK